MTERYRKELRRLSEVAAEFAATYPALAPMLAGPCLDPDVERLLEGVAYQNAQLREKLEADLPGFIHELARLIYPQLTQPVPATTIVAFAPDSAKTGSRTIPKGTQLASTPVDGAPCFFRTCADIDLHPLQLIDAFLRESAGAEPAIELSFVLDEGLTVSDWAPRALKLHLCGEYPAAADLYHLFCRYLRSVVLIPDSGGRPAILPAVSVRAAGFSEDEPLLQYPARSFPAYRLLQEYFAIPHRFLFLELAGWELWKDRGTGTGFSVRFELAPGSFPLPRIGKESFALFAAPAVNLFSHAGEPILLDHRRERYLIRPCDIPPCEARIFSVDRVTGRNVATGCVRTYHPFERFLPLAAGDASYQVVPGQKGALYLETAYPPGAGMPEVEALSLDLTCTNGTRPGRLAKGELCRSPSGSFRIVAPVAPGMLPPSDQGELARLVSHLLLTREPVRGAEQLRALLHLYLFEVAAERQVSHALRKRIEAIEELVCRPDERLLGGDPIFGSNITVSVNGASFAGTGDLFVFGAILDRLFAASAPLNTFTSLTVREISQGGVMPWPPRLGDQTVR